MARENFALSIPSTQSMRGNAQPLTTTTVADAEYSAETVSGTRRRKPKGWIPPTGYDLSVKKYSRARGYNYHRVNNAYLDKWGVIGGSYLFNSLNQFNSVISEASANDPLSTSAAIVAAKNKMKDMKVDLGTAYGERKATSRMLGDTARRMANAARDLRRGNFRDAARQIGIKGDPGRPRGSNWTNHWLQLQYGWKPLLSDVYGACDALARRPKEDWRVTSSAYRQDNQKFVNMRLPGATHDYGYYFRTEAERQRGVYTRIDAIPVNDLTMSLASLGVTNPLNVAWELVPFSFVVDWAYPVGNWLQSLDALLGYTSIYTSTTTYNKTVWSDVGLSKVWSEKDYVKASWRGSKELLKIKRSASSGTPWAPLPSFKDPASLGHMANGLSLLAQAFGKR